MRDGRIKYKEILPISVLAIASLALVCTLVACGGGPTGPLATASSSTLPLVNALFPTSGPSGTTVTILGLNFCCSPQNPPTVSFGGTKSDSVTFISSTQLQAMAPKLPVTAVVTTIGLRQFQAATQAATASPVDVVVINPDGQKSVPPPSGAASFAFSAPPIAVAVAPLAPTVNTGAQQQFTGTVTGSSNTAVTWSVNGIVGGNAIVGMISAAGLYTAPAVAPSSNTVTVTATSSADTTKSASATVTIPPPAPTAHSVSLAWDPAATQPAGVTVTGYHVWRQIPPCSGTTAGKMIIASVGVATTTYPDPNLLASTTYCYAVTAVAASGDSPPATTLLDPTKTEVQATTLP